MLRRLMIACVSLSVILLLLNIRFRGVSAQVNCASPQKHLGDLRNQLQDAQSALHDSESCFGTRGHADCMQRIAQLETTIANGAEAVR